MSFRILRRSRYAILFSFLLMISWFTVAATDFKELLHQCDPVLHYSLFSSRVCRRPVQLHHDPAQESSNIDHVGTFTVHRRLTLEDGRAHGSADGC